MGLESKVATLTPWGKRFPPYQGDFGNRTYRGCNEFGLTSVFRDLILVSRCESRPRIPPLPYRGDSSSFAVHWVLSRVSVLEL